MLHYEAHILVDPNVAYTFLDGRLFTHYCVSSILYNSLDGKNQKIQIPKLAKILSHLHNCGYSDNKLYMHDNNRN